MRANSDSDEDQRVKIAVRDAVNEYISKNISAATFTDAYKEIALRLNGITAVATGVLEKNGFFYGASAQLKSEYFPSRIYGNVVVPEGSYDALIIELGAGAGDNWWCVIYPPMCYGEQFEYKSFFAELFA